MATAMRIHGNEGYGTDAIAATRRAKRCGSTCLRRTADWRTSETPEGQRALMVQEGVCRSLPDGRVSGSGARTTPAWCVTTVV
jgi:hypothetical protein